MGWRKHKLQTDRIEDPRIAEACAYFDFVDRKKGFALLDVLARTGSSLAMFLLARFYTTGEVPGVDRDQEKALYWLERAYVNGSVGAAIDLHKTYLFGKSGVVQNDEKAFGCVTNFERFDRPNILQAQGTFLLASAYELGRGTAKDIPKAQQLYRRAAAAGHLPSKINMTRRQIVYGNLLAIVPFIIAVFQAQILVLLKGRKKAWMDPRMRV